jgi:hypothetical protein
MDQNKSCRQISFTNLSRAADSGVRGSSPPQDDDDDDCYAHVTKFEVLPATHVAWVGDPPVLDIRRMTDAQPRWWCSGVTMALSCLEERICFRLNGNPRNELKDLSEEHAQELRQLLGPAAFSPTEGKCMIEHLLQLRFAGRTPDLWSLPWAVFRASVTEPGDDARHAAAKDYLLELFKSCRMFDNSRQNILCDEIDCCDEPW